MIIFAFGYEPRSEGKWDTIRTVFEVCRWKGGVGAGFTTQGRNRSTGEWESGVQPFHVNITRHFYLGPDHMWYDGPHCFFSLGWIHIYRENWNCLKCHGEVL